VKYGKNAAGIVALLIIAAGVTTMVWLGDNATAPRRQLVTVSQPDALKTSTELREDAVPRLGPSGLPHDRPPPLEALRDYSHAQSVYDQEAKPGDFVTPPAVSVEH
jgi:hypothetical protein